MENLPTTLIISYIISFLGHVLVLIACVVLLIKHKSLATTLMLIGMVLSIVFSILGLLGNYVSAQTSAEAMLRTQGLFATLNTLSYLVFGLGLLLLAIKTVHKTVDSRITNK